MTKVMPFPNREVAKDLLFTSTAAMKPLRHPKARTCLLFASLKLAHFYPATSVEERPFRATFRSPATRPSGPLRHQG
jgi:hypothetical protein